MVCTRNQQVFSAAFCVALAETGEFPCPNGAPHVSPGHRPGYETKNH